MVTFQENIATSTSTKTFNCSLFTLLDESLLLTLADEPCAGSGGCSYRCAVIDEVEQCFCPTGFVLHKFNRQACIGKLLNDPKLQSSALFAIA